MYFIPLKLNLVKNYNQFPLPTKVMKITLERDPVRRLGWPSFEPSIFKTKYVFILIYVLLYVNLVLNTFSLGLLSTSITTRGVHIRKIQLFLPRVN